MKNIILITIDCLRKDTLGLYGNKGNLTPFIDSLRNRSIIFSKAQSTGPYTQASFPGLLTSSYYLDYGKPSGLAKERILVSEPLKKGGITTAAFHSNPYICEHFGWNRSWNVFYDSMQDEVEPRIPYVRGNVINTKVINWLSNHCSGAEYNSFFLWLHYMDAHEPYMPERRYIDLVDPSITISQDQMFNLFEETLLKRDVSDPEKVMTLRRLYDIHIREVDTYIQEFFSSLENLNILKDTVVIITNDHGDEFNDHGGLSHDEKMYRELIDSPLLIVEPDRTGALTCDNLVSNIDIPPTIVNLFGINPVSGFKGHSLLPIDNYPQQGVFGEAINQHTQKGGNIDQDSYFYREQDVKIIYHAENNAWEMYDLINDPEEKINIINSSLRADVMKSKLKPRVRRWN